MQRASHELRPCSAGLAQHAEPIFRLGSGCNMRAFVPVSDPGCARAKTASFRVAVDFSLQFPPRLRSHQPLEFAFQDRNGEFNNSGVVFLCDGMPHLQGFGTDWNMEHPHRGWQFAAMPAYDSGLIWRDTMLPLLLKTSNTLRSDAPYGRCDFVRSDALGEHLVNHVGPDLNSKSAVGHPVRPGCREAFVPQRLPRFGSDDLFDCGLRVSEVLA